MNSVLPSIDPEYFYDNLNFKEGSQAGSEFLRMRNIEEKQEIGRLEKI